MIVKYIIVHVHQLNIEIRKNSKTCLKRSFSVNSEEGTGGTDPRWKLTSSIGFHKQLDPPPGKV